MFLTNVINPLGVTAISLKTKAKEKKGCIRGVCIKHTHTQEYNLGGAYFSKEFRTMTPKRLKAPRPTTKALSDELVLL